MHIIEVIPITKGMGGRGADTLSYFSAKAVPLGAIVNVPLRSRTIQGIVTGIRHAKDIKAEIKQAPYALRKVEKLNATEFLSPAFLRAAERASLHYATSLGTVLDALLPDSVLKSIGKLKTSIKPATHASLEGQVTRNPHNTEIYAVQGDDEERFGTWKSLIRQEFAKKSSLIFLAPTIEDAKRTFDLIEKGIEGYAFLLHSNLPVKKIVEVWNKAMTTKHPIAIVITGGFLSFSRPDIQTIIVEKENGRGYKSQRRPFLDARFITEQLVRESEPGMRLFFGDILLRTETLAREADTDILQASPFKFRSLSTADDQLIDMRTYKNAKGTFKILSDEVEALITETKDSSQHMMILATRRGVAPTTVCGDCQNIVTCNNCSSPMVIHKSRPSNGASVEKNFFLCHHCGERRTSEEYCKVCGSWKLGTVGIGIDLVEEKIRDKFPGTAIFRIDSDTTPTEKAASAIIAKWRAKPASILLGTEMMLSYIHERVDNAAVVSIDSLFALPDYRIQEKILYTLIRMRARTAKRLIVQTRRPEERLFEYALKGNLSDFYRLTVEERKRFNYPPFATLIKITLEGSREEIVAEMATIQTMLQDSDRIVEVFPAFTHTVRGNLVLHGLIRVPRSEWPDDKLISKLRSLPPSVTVNVDPESLL